MELSGSAAPAPSVDTNLCDGPRPLADVLADYRANGWARVGRLCSEPELEALRARIDAIMLGEVVYPGMFFQRDTDNGSYDDLSFGKGYEGPTLRYRKIEKLEMDPLFLRWIEDPRFYAIAREVVGPKLTLYRALVFNKAAETGGSYLPWHQDGGRFWGLDRDPTLQIWTALDDAPVNGGCIEVLPGSHLRGLATSLGGVVPKHLLEEHRAEERAVRIPARAGEVLLIHNMLWHRSVRSETGKPRRALTACYMDAATRCLRTKRAPRVFFPLFQDASLTSARETT